MQAFRQFLRSPLARHPVLMVRKVASRLGLSRRNLPVPAPVVSAVICPVHWAPALKEWVRHVPFHPGPHPFHRVLGHDFDEAMLLGLCRDGPRPGERGLTGDIKLIWDYSRGHPLFTNAAAGPAHLEACVAFVRRWLEANGNTHGPAWVCAMDVAIRALNWIFADALSGGELARRLGPAEWAGWLWRHGHVIWRDLEARWISSNHYLANLLGLFVIGTVFPGDARAQAWRRFAQGEFPRALLAQTRRDGGLAEASLRYHAFVTEMALLFRLALGSPLPHGAEARLRDMCRIVADFRDATGDVFAIGDDDSGRILALDCASSMGRADILLGLASSLLGEEFKTSPGAACLESGWWVQRAGDFALALDFGGVGLHGLGAHAHNDDFSVCLEWRGQPVITDPGTFLYTSDLEARNRFRSTLFHNTVMIDGREQRELNHGPFLLRGPDEAFEARRSGEEPWAFTRPLAPGVSHRREVRVCSGEVSIRDVVGGSGSYQLQWRFHVHPSVRPQLAAQGFTLMVPGTGSLLLEATDTPASFEIILSEHSAAYGRRQPALACLAQGTFSLPVSVEWRLRAGGDAPS